MGGVSVVDPPLMGAGCAPTSMLVVLLFDVLDMKMFRGVLEKR